MSSTYVRRFNLKSSLTDQQVNDFWKLLMGELVPAIRKVEGVRSCKIYSGAGALRADIRLVAEMDHAGVYKPCCAIRPSASNLGYSMGLWT